ncbi:SLC13 family permease [Ligilactobacillus pobuzihii]|uniref:Citrate transporter-like domain-containing protein n=1 Tax=Ligilactobacillus pobuzihii TaxID=449659 RepID=A0A0R2L1B3_9LACO|nr:SLC13 family permease [Ligilactobacillus pobuzihii]KRK09453.1 hypothetical protein FD11_GL000776 [Ligilactobacillus pobuzihii E100301 = KCTC 13174]KRN95579.1 hypothetical protein IV66_GL001023 [Ligilactobacillus pobuzihii]GEN48003.1 hypothetical protein LPO01_07950 [Ligilactobacillus pobuzihii]
MEKKKIIDGKTLVGLAIITVFWFSGSWGGMSGDAVKVAGIFIGTLFLWLTVDISWPSMLSIALLSLVPSLGPESVFASSFGNSTFLFLMFTFIVTYTLSQTSMIKRIAVLFVTNRFAQRGPWSFTLSFFAVILLLGLFMSPTILFFLLLPILEEIFSLLDLQKGESFAELLMVGLVAFTCLAAGMTPIAHVYPVIALGILESLTNISVGNFAYIEFALPAGLLIFAAVILLWKLLFKPDMTKFKQLTRDDFAATFAHKLTRREKWIITIFAIIVAAWILPEPLKSLWPNIPFDLSKYGNAFPPLVGTVVLAILNIDGKPLLNLKDALSNGVSWPTLLMSTGTLALGAALTSKKVGLLDVIRSGMGSLIKGQSLALVVVLFIVWTALESSFSSHIMTVQVVVSLAVPTAMATGQLNVAALACVIGMASSTGIAAPSAMPATAAASGSGWANTSSLMKYGLVLLVVVIVVMAVVAYPLAASIL